jgi:hypothetical protein
MDKVVQGLRRRDCSPVAFHQLHHIALLPARDLRDVWVAQRSQHFRFALELRMSASFARKG